MSAATPIQSNLLTLIPAPATVTIGEGAFILSKSTRVVCRDPAAAGAAQMVQAAFKTRFGLDLVLAVQIESPASVTGALVFELAPVAGDVSEGYALEIAPAGVTVRAATAAGFFYGAQSLLQLAAAATPAATGEIALPRLHLADQPRFAWRGVMLDESRHFFGKPTVMKLLDLMAGLKLNRFHWHLTDEPGWRIEIKKYPRLTTIGAKGDWSDPEAPPAFYTQAEIREIVAYAGERHIVIVPEIDMPGHATAACRAYPEISGGGAAPWVGFTFNPARKETYHFIEEVLTEIAALFPGPYIHLGGDEVHYGNQSWSTDPEIVEFTRAQGLKDAAELERYFVRRMAAVIRSLGKTPIGWDEVGSAGLSPAGSVAQWWRHDKPEVLAQLLAQKFPVVLSPRLPLYFDFVQDESHTQGRRWKGEFNSLDRVYDFPDATTQKQIEAATDPNILGLEACVWTERIQEPHRLWFMTLPRLAALAEAAWTPAANKSHTGFNARLRELSPEWKRRGLSGFNPFAPAETPEPAGAEKKVPEPPKAARPDVL